MAKASPKLHLSLVKSAIFQILLNKQSVTNKLEKTNTVVKINAIFSTKCAQVVKKIKLAVSAK